MSKTKQELIDSLRKSFSKNKYLEDLYKEITEINTKAEGLKKLRREYPYVYNDVIELSTYLPLGEESLIKELISLN